MSASQEDGKGQRPLALAKLPALGERQLGPALAALLPPPGHSRPRLRGPGWERLRSLGYGFSTGKGGHLAVSLRTPLLCPGQLRLSVPRTPPARVAECARDKVAAGWCGQRRTDPQHSVPERICSGAGFGAGREPETMYPRVESGGSHRGAR